MDDPLVNYFAFVAKIDELCANIASDFSDQITCHAGCDECCRHISIVRVEAMALAYALSLLKPDEIEAIRRQAETAAPDGPCPLLVNKRCALYDHRPIICRTHGLPILLHEESGDSMSCCRENFNGSKNLPGTAVINLERLNTILDSINRLFISDFLSSQPDRERLTIAKALLLEIDPHGDQP